jgi:4a-hydroxytetrahydrobiopterin dehydratase
VSERPLAERRCVPCEAGTPPIERAEAERLLGQLRGWRIDDAGGRAELVKTFRFPDFLGAVAFVNALTPIAEEEGHHPDLAVSWGKAEVRLTTHAAGGLTENDFVLAAKIDLLPARS